MIDKVVKKSPEQAQNFFNHPNATPEQRAQYTTPGHLKVQTNTQKLRKLRDFIEEKGGTIHKKEAEQSGFNLKKLGVEGLLQNGRNLNASDVAEHINKIPSEEYRYGSEEYGSPSVEHQDDRWSEAQREAMSDHSGKDYLREIIKSPSDIPDEMQDAWIEHLTDEYDMPDSEDEDAYSEWDNNLDAEDTLSSFIDEHGSDQGWDTEGYYEWIDEKVGDYMSNGNWNESDFRNEDQKDALEHAHNEQRHNQSASQVFSLRAGDSHEQELKDAGVYDDYEKLKEHTKSRHPDSGNSLGWVRYTEDDDGIHMDEVQSDFGDSIRKIFGSRKDGEPGNDRLPEVSDDSLKKISDILYRGNTPTQLLHDSFLAYSRKQGEDGKDVHIWTPETKAPLSHLKVPHKTMKAYVGEGRMAEEVPVKLTHFSKLHPEDQKKIADHAWAHVHSEGGQEHPKWKGALKTEEGNNLPITEEHIHKWLPALSGYRGAFEDTPNFYTHAKTGQMVTPVSDDSEGKPFAQGRLLPVKTIESYSKQPKEMGYTPGKYGELKNQDNPNLQGQATFKDKVRKKKELNLPELEKSKPNLIELLRKSNDILAKEANKSEFDEYIDAFRALPFQDKVREMRSQEFFHSPRRDRDSLEYIHEYLNRDPNEQSHVSFVSLDGPEKDQIRDRLDNLTDSQRGWLRDTSQDPNEMTDRLQQLAHPEFNSATAQSLIKKELKENKELTPEDLNSVLNSGSANIILEAAAHPNLDSSNVKTLIGLPRNHRPLMDSEMSALAVKHFNTDDIRDYIQNGKADRWILQDLLKGDKFTPDLQIMAADSMNPYDAQKFADRYRAAPEVQLKHGSGFHLLDVIKNPEAEGVPPYKQKIIDSLKPEHFERMLSTGGAIVDDIYVEMMKVPNFTKDVVDELINNNLGKNNNIASRVAYGSPHLTQDQKNKLLSDKGPASGWLIENPSNTPNEMEHYYKTSGVKWGVAGHPNTPQHVLADMADDPDVAGKVARNPSSNSETIDKIFDIATKNGNKTIADAAHNHPNASPGLFRKFMEHFPVENELNVKIDSHKLRQLRDFIEEKGGVVGKKDAEKAGFNLKSMGAHNLPDGKGKLTTDKVQEHIDSLPDTKFTHSSSTYGENFTGGDSDNWRDWDEDAYYHAAEQEEENARDNYSWGEYIADSVTFKDIPQDVMDEYKNFWRKNIQEDEDFTPEDEWDEEWDDNKNRYLLDFIEDINNTSGYSRKADNFANSILENYNEYISEDLDVGPPSSYDLSDFSQIKNEGYSANESDYQDAMGTGQQQHSTEESQVFQMNLHPETIKELKNEGVWDTYQNMYDESHMSGHPVGENGIGWVRYTKGEDGIHIDEVQSDFGQGFARDIKRAQEMAAQGNQAAKELVKKYPTDTVDKINNIVFKNKHPSQLLYDSFFQHLRNTGQDDTPVHTWNVESKAPISGLKLPKEKIDGDDVSLAHFSQLKPEVQDEAAETASLRMMNNPHLYKKAVKEGLYNEDNGENLISKDNWQKWLPHVSDYDEEYNPLLYVDKKTKEPVTTNTGGFSAGKALPVHQKITYQEIPQKKLGMKPDSYGKLETQHNPILKEEGAKTFSDKVRKTDEELPSKKLRRIK